eukprot:NODE_120_length_17920_cov_0.559782.p12 type:complete len:146 gc:universal NODE_120_length_17920_cov_0.559782:11395-11832(+)
MIRTIGVEKWLINLQPIAFALRASIYFSLKQSPSEMIFGLDMVLPQFNNNKRIFESPTQSVIRDLKLTNKKRINHPFKISDLILLRKEDRNMTSKWDTQQEGPYKIVECHTNNAVTINKHGLLQRVKYRKVIPCKSNDGKDGRMS